MTIFTKRIILLVKINSLSAVLVMYIVYKAKKKEQKTKTLLIL